MSQSHSLDDRYGRSRSATLGRRIALGILAGLGLIALIAWAIWANPLKIGPSVEARDTGHVIVDASTVEVQFSVTVTPGHPFACAIEALNTGFGVVGWKVFVYPASDQRTLSLSESVKTTEPATTGFVSNCWLT